MEDKITENEALVVLDDIVYPVTKQDIHEFLVTWKNVPEIDLSSPTRKEEYKNIVAGYRTVVSFRTSIERKRKELKHPAIAYGKKVDLIAKEFQGMISGKESELNIQKVRFENEIQREKDELEEKERARIANINDKIAVISNYPLSCLNLDSGDTLKMVNDIKYPTEDIFNEYVDLAINTYDSTIETLTTMVKEKKTAEAIEKERRELEAERRKELEKLEEERKKEKEAIEKERRELEAERNEINRIKQKEIDDKEKREKEAHDKKREKENKEKLAAIEKKKKEESIAESKKQKDILMEKYNETKLELERYEDFGSAGSLLDDIISNKFKYIKWEI